MMDKQETPEMVERVARAILKARFYDIEPEAYEGPDDFWASMDRNDHIAEAEFEARAAIEALMEPTEAMLRAGDRPGWDDSVTVGLALEIWQAMLRAALSQGDDK